MRSPRLAEINIVACPDYDCRHKQKRFKSVRELNMHLTKKHHSRYRISLDSLGYAHLSTK